MNDEVLEQAARWQAAEHRDDMDWGAFTAWLEADPRHREAFDEVALLDERIAVHRAALRDAGAAMPPGVEGRPAARRRIARWAGAAAALVAVVGGGVLLRRPGDAVAAATAYRAGGATRALRLGDGVAVSLAAGSVLTVEEAGPRRLSLAGRAFFDVRHDAGRPLLVVASGYRIEDLGTRFDVATGDGMVSVAVDEGRVAMTPPAGGRAVDLVAGQSATGLANGRLGVAAARDVGGWRRGPLVYDRVPLGIVAAEVGRVSGRAVTVDPAIGARPFSGVLSPASPGGLVDALAVLAGLQSGRDGGSIRLRDRARR